MDEAARGDDFLYKTVAAVQWASLDGLVCRLGPSLSSQVATSCSLPLLISSTIFAVCPPRRRVFADSSDGAANEGILSGLRIGWSEDRG